MHSNDPPDLDDEEGPPHRRRDTCNDVKAHPAAVSRTRLGWFQKESRAGPRFAIGTSASRDCSSGPVMAPRADGSRKRIGCGTPAIALM